jgi:o-succinylbenzoate synthase
MNLAFEKIELRFLFPAGTSRGVLRKKPSWILKCRELPAVQGECSVIPGLNKDFISEAQYEDKVRWVCETFTRLFSQLSRENLLQFFCIELHAYPSILFGVETIFYQLGRLKGEDALISEFSKGHATIPINGLIWMGTIAEMRARVQEKLSQGFMVLKFKIGAMDFDQEFTLLSEVRNSFGTSIVIRVDANGAFNLSNIHEVLKKLKSINVHSIEQPIKAGQIEEMRVLCENTNVPIALDEELIGVNGMQEKTELLEKVKPQFIILKPSLHGGLVGTLEWVSLAEKMGIGWWITSALESSIGLEMIARLAGFLNPSIPQGLGTGGLFENNFDSPLVIQNGTLTYKNV